MTEAVLTRNIVKALNALPQTFAAKIHGGPHQRKGLPDIVGCSQGLYFGLEIKLPGKENTLTTIQEATLTKIYRAGGLGQMVTTVEQAVRVVEEWLTENDL